MRRGQLRERQFEREQKLLPFFEEFRQFFQRDRALKPELTRARAAERGEVRARTQVSA